MLKKLVSHTAIYGLVPQLPKLVSIFTLPIITKFLVPLDFGVYGLITAVISAVSVFNLLGLNIALTNYFIKSPHRYKIAWRQIYGFLMLWSIPYSILISIIVWVFIPDEARENYIYIVLSNVGPVILFGPTSILGTYYYQLKQMPLQVAIRGAVFGLLGVLLTLFFIVYLKMGYMGWFWSAGITQISLQLSYWYPVNIQLGLTPIFNFKRRFINRQLMIGLPTVPHYYGAYFLNTADRFLMKMLGVPISSIGLYNASSTVSNLYATVGTAAGQAVSPMMLKGYKDKNDYSVRRLIFVLQTLFLTCGFLSCIWLKEIFSFLIKNKELASTYHIGIILVMSYCYRPMYLGASNFLFYNEKTKSLPLITFAAGIITVFLNCILIPIWGFQVAAYTTFIGLMYMGYSGYYLKSFKTNNVLEYYPLRWLASTVIITILSYFMVDYDIKIKILISISVLVVIFFNRKKFLEEK